MVYAGRIAEVRTGRQALRQVFREAAVVNMCALESLRCIGGGDMQVPKVWREEVRGWS